MDTLLSYISILLGWLYFIAWSISFYPQVILNYQRKSVTGLSLEFQAYNLTGFTFYSIYTFTLYTLQQIHQYDCCYTDNAVQFNDVAFAVHALIITLITVYQCIIYRTKQHHINTTHLYIVLLLWSIAIYNTLLSIFDYLSWYNGTYNTIQYLGYAKALISFIKYTPQGYLNYKRQSTVGFSIYNILCDFTGGMLSMSQQVIDSYRYNDITIITGNIPKLLLAIQSILFDILFIIQHYILYRHRNLLYKHTLLNEQDSIDYVDDNDTAADNIEKQHKTIDNDINN